MAGFFSKKQYAAIADKELAIKLLNERCLECSICAMFFNYESRFFGYDKHVREWSQQN